MAEKIEGGAILNGSELNRLLNLTHEENAAYGLAIRAIGQSTIAENSAAVKVYTIYKDGQSFYFVDNDTYKYKPTHGCTEDEPTTSIPIADVKFEHHAEMAEHNFCFCIYGAGTVRGKIGDGPEFDDIFLASNIVSDALMPNIESAFTFAIKKNSTADNQFIVDAAPCPPFWKVTDVPTGRNGFMLNESAILEKWKEDAPQETTETICADSI